MTALPTCASTTRRSPTCGGRKSRPSISGLREGCRARDTEKQLIVKKDAREKQWKTSDMDLPGRGERGTIAEVPTATGIPVFKSPRRNPSGCCGWRMSCTSG
jgi:hypothetical protein